VMCVGGGKIHERRPMAPWPRAGLTMPRSPATGRAGAEWNRTLKQSRSASAVDEPTAVPMRMRGA
jgi:hypothetical protein